MKKRLKLSITILAALGLTVSAHGFSTPFISELTGDINPYSRLELGDKIITKSDGDSFYKGYSLITLMDMIGDNDGYGYGHEVVGDGNELPPVSGYGWDFDNRSSVELSASNGAQATDLENTFDVTFSHTFDISQFDYLTEAYFTIDISGLQQNIYGGVSRLFMDGIEVMEFLTIDQGVWGSGLLTYAVDVSLLSDGALDVYYDNWMNDFGGDHTGIDFTMLTVKGFAGDVIPEPATMVLFGLGMAGLGVTYKLRK